MGSVKNQGFEVLERPKKGESGTVRTWPDVLVHLYFVATVGFLLL